MPTTEPTEPKKLPSRFGRRFTRIRERAEGFWQRVTEGIELGDLWTQFKTEARASYGLYSQEVDWDAVKQQSRWRRPLHIGRALFWAMMTKLSPARRVFLLLALLLVALAVLGSRPFGVSRDLEFLFAAGALLVLLALELADRVSMKRDLEIAREIQRWLVPEVPPQVPGVDMAFAARPANTIAGDYYDAFLRGTDGAAGTGRLLLVVADVAGKSVPAALLMATLQASLQALAALPTSLAELVAGLNRYACAHSLGGLRFTTAFLAELDPAARALSYICAGHNAPILRRVSGGFERLEAGGLPLGIAADARYSCSIATLAPGDLLVVFTDGVIEAEDGNGEEYGEQRLLGRLRTTPGASAGETLKDLMADLDRFVGRARQRDDITCLVLRAV